MLSAPHRFRDRQRFKRALALPRIAGNQYFSLCGQAKPALESGLSTQKAEGGQSSGVPTEWAVVASTTQWSVVVSKKVCRKAVDRNRLRRRLQALLRQHIVAATTSDSSPLWQQYSGLVVITRPPTAKATFEELASGLQELLQRIRHVLPLKPLGAKTCDKA